MTTSRSRARDDGNISVFSLGTALFAILLILVVASATSVHVQRMRLVALADELALAAADSLDLGMYYSGDAPAPDEDRAIVLSPARMNEAVVDHLSHRAHGRLAGVEVIEVWTPDGATAHVTVRLTVHPLFLVEPLLPFHDGIDLTASSSARTF